MEMCIAKGFGGDRKAPEKSQTETSLLLFSFPLMIYNLLQGSFPLADFV